MRLKRHKYNAVSIVHDCIKFRSKAEGRRYQELKLLKLAGEVRFFLRQPQFDLGGGTTYTADFQIFWTAGDITFEDVKGFETKDFIMKKKIVEDKYPIMIEVVKMR